MEESCDTKCTTLTVWVERESNLANQFDTQLGIGVNQDPFFDKPNGTQIGVYSNFAMFPQGFPPAESAAESVECFVTSVYSFGHPDPVTGFYSSTIDLSHTCTSKFNTIIGGTGDYGCATGYEDGGLTLTEDGSFGSSTLEICGCLCPPPSDH